MSMLECYEIEIPQVHKWKIYASGRITLSSVTDILHT